MEYLHIFSDIAKFIEHLITIGGYPLLFLLIFFEGLPLIGTVIPGHIAIVFSGFLVNLGVFSPYFTVSTAILAAILGDYLGYSIGRKYGMGFIDKFRPFFFIRDSHIDRAQKLIANHTGKSMLIGRVSPMTRALVPFLVGVSHSDLSTPKDGERKFWFFNIIGATLWVICSIGLGYIFGAGYYVAVAYTGKLIMIIVILAIIMIWGYHFINKQFDIFRRYELFMLILAIVSGATLAYTMRDTFLASSLITDWDVRINIFVLEHVTDKVARFAEYISYLGGFTTISISGILLATIMTLRHKWRSAIIVFVGLGSTIISLGLLKEFFMRVRPMYQLVETALIDPSFPSGHSAMAAAFFVIVAYLAMPRINSWIVRESVFGVCVLTILAVGASRVILSVHWLSDVISGWSLGILCAALSVLFVRYVANIVHKKVIEVTNS